MAHELGIDKVNIGLAMHIMTREKMKSKYCKPGETFNGMMNRVCEELTKDVKLSKSQIDEIDKKIAENYKRRMEKREKEKRGK